MLSLRSSADTLTANLAQQGSAILLFIVIPNVLPVADYALTVIAGIILSFLRFPDLGLSLVYGRDAPHLYASGNNRLLESWNRTVLWFGALAGSAGGIIAAIALHANGGAIGYAMLLAMVPPLAALSSAYLSFAAASANFRRYRDVQILLAIGRLLAIPLAFFMGLIGWFIAHVAALLLVLVKSGIAWMPRPPRVDWQLTKVHLPSAVQLAVITLIWSQLLDSARLLAAVHYDTEAIAAYGIIVAGYQSAYSLIIAAFLPMSVRTLQLMGSDDQAAVDYVRHVIQRSLPVVFVLTVIAAELAPWVLNLLFPRYAIDPVAPRIVVYGLCVMPIVATVGNLLVGKKRNGMYLVILVLSFAAAVGIEQLLRPRLAMQAAAFAQVAGTFALALMLLIAGQLLFKQSRVWTAPLLWLLGLWASYFALRHYLVGSFV